MLEPKSNHTHLQAKLKPIQSTFMLTVLSAAQCRHAYVILGLSACEAQSQGCKVVHPQAPFHCEVLRTSNVFPGQQPQTQKSMDCSDVPDSHKPQLQMHMVLTAAHMRSTTPWRMRSNTQTYDTVEKQGETMHPLGSTVVSQHCLLVNVFQRLVHAVSWQHGAAPGGRHQRRQAASQANANQTWHNMKRPTSLCTMRM